jgi:hypothetical protein
MPAENTTGEKKMKENKITKKMSLVAVALILLMTASVLFAVAPFTSAQSSTVIPSNTYLVVSPNPAGINNEVNVMFWLDNTPPQIDSKHYYGWNYTVTIVKPDGTSKTVGPFESDAVGGWYYVLHPDKEGIYKFTAHFQGATMNLPGPSPPKGTYTFAASDSRTVELTVGNTTVEAWPETPLPTGAWTFPINAENRDWWVLAGNWIGQGSPVYNTQAPNSAHVLWTKQLTFGGIEGDQGWGINWYTGLLYENKFNPKIISGRLYYNMWTGPGMFASGVPSGVICVDMQTGQEIWRNDSMPQIAAAQILEFDSGFQSGTTAYLWTSSGSTWQMYDAFTGRWLTNFVNATGSPGSTFGPMGEMLAYSLDSTRNYLSMWNSTKAVIPTSGREGADTYKPWTSPTRDWRNGIQWNVSIPDVPGSQSVQFTSMADHVILAQATITFNTTTPTFVHVGYRTELDATYGQQIWVRNITNVGYGAGGPTSAGLLTFTQARGEGCYAFFQKETMQWHVIDIKTGIEKWVTEPLNTYTNTDYSVYDWSAQIAYGKLICDGYSGCVVAFDLKTGEHLWTFDQGSSGLMTPYGTWPSFGGVTCADNKVFFGVTEHTPNTPMLRGYRLYAIDVNTGAKLWEMPGFFTSIGIAGGKLVGYAGYDNQIYCYAPGTSATTVTASSGIGNAVTIQGTVTDDGPGQTAWSIPAKGTPAISDDSMDAWMAYLYMQQAKPTNATGVPVHLTVKDAAGTTVFTEDVTSDAQGHYATSWTPSTTGLYTVTANFDGSKSYYASEAVTSIAIGTFAANPTANPTESPTIAPTTAAPTETAAPTTTAPEPKGGENTVIYVAVAAVIAIVAIAAVAIALRRRK